LLDEVVAALLPLPPPPLDLPPLQRVKEGQRRTVKRIKVRRE